MYRVIILNLILYKFIILYRNNYFFNTIIIITIKSLKLF